MAVSQDLGLTYIYMIHQTIANGSFSLKNMKLTTKDEHRLRTSLGPDRGDKTNKMTIYSRSKHSRPEPLKSEWMARDPRNRSLAQWKEGTQY